MRTSVSYKNLYCEREGMRLPFEDEDEEEEGDYN